MSKEEIINLLEARLAELQKICDGYSNTIALDENKTRVNRLMNRRDAIKEVYKTNLEILKRLKE